MRYRVEELAARAGVRVDTVRYYQRRGLLPRPQREGRAAWYGDEHLAQLEQIRALKERGLPLATIERLLGDALDPADAALASALRGPLPGEDDRGELLDLDGLAERTGVSVALLEAIAREGFLVPRTVAGRPAYTAADADAVRAGLALLEAGLPLGELLDLSRRYDRAMREVADAAVDAFVRFVRDPIQGSAGSEQEAAERLVTAFRQMLPAVGGLVAHHFRRLLLASAQARIEAEGTDEEIALARAESARAAQAP